MAIRAARVLRAVDREKPAVRIYVNWPSISVGIVDDAPCREKVFLNMRKGSCKVRTCLPTKLSGILEGVNEDEGYETRTWSPD